MARVNSLQRTPRCRLGLPDRHLRRGRAARVGLVRHPRRVRHAHRGDCLGLKARPRLRERALPVPRRGRLRRDQRGRAAENLRRTRLRAVRYHGQLGGRAGKARHRVARGRVPRRRVPRAHGVGGQTGQKTLYVFCLSVRTKGRSMDKGQGPNHPVPCPWTTTLLAPWDRHSRSGTPRSRGRCGVCYPLPKDAAFPRSQHLRPVTFSHTLALTVLSVTGNRDGKHAGETANWRVTRLRRGLVDG